MFNKLKLKLTLVNVIIVVLIFITVFTGVYLTMYKSIVSQSEQLINMLSYSIISGSNPEDPRMLGLLGNQAFIIVDIDSAGMVAGYRSTPFMPKPAREQVDELVRNALSPNGKIRIRINDTRINGVLESKTAIIILEQNTIRLDREASYLTRLIKKADGSLSLLFVNIDYENRLLKSLRSSLIIMALTGLALVFVGSLYMAGRAIKPIKTAWEKQKTFVADASHELRTPLSVMQSNLELVMENKEETVESQTKWLENIYLENKHMTKLVNDLLLLARADADQKLLEMKDFSLSALVEEAATPLLLLAEEKNINMDLLIDPNITFYGDESRMKQLVVILIDNAVKYTPKGGSISLELKNLKDGIELIVADTGEGIDKENLEKIFQRFYRVDKARSSESGGIGLGLSIASWIVKEHRGTINAASSLGEGTTFRVVFSNKERLKRK